MFIYAGPCITCICTQISTYVSYVWYMFSDRACTWQIVVKEPAHNARHREVSLIPGSEDPGGGKQPTYGLAQELYMDRGSLGGPVQIMSHFMTEDLASMHAHIVCISVYVSMYEFNVTNVSTHGPPLITSFSFPHTPYLHMHTLLQACKTSFRMRPAPHKSCKGLFLCS